MKKAVAMMILLAGGMFAAPAVRIGIGFGAPARVAVVRPVCPGPGYTWMDGYYAPNGAFVAGYWAPPVIERVVPRYEQPRVFVEHRDEHSRFDNSRYEHSRLDNSRYEHSRDDHSRHEQFRR